MRTAKSSATPAAVGRAATTGHVALCNVEARPFRIAHAVVKAAAEAAAAIAARLASCNEIEDGGIEADDDREREALAV
jgi:hypothetical protein